MLLTENDLNTYREHIKTHVYTSSKEASIAIAHRIAKLIAAKQEKNNPCVLGLATGSSPKGVYKELIRMHREEGLSFRNVITFNLDEYYPMEPDALQSYVRFMHEQLFDHIDIPQGNTNIPDGTIKETAVNDYCRQYEQKIEQLGGLDLQLLGIGRTGHVGFNEPGSGINSPTRLITLDSITRTDTASDFFGQENVPRRAVTMGIGTIMKAREIVLMGWGEAKARVLQQTIEGPVSEQIPASFLQHHSHCMFYLDEAAASELTRLKTPWLLDECSWDDRLIRKAVVWLCQQVNKPILKLTDRDYNDFGMGSLLSQQGSAYELNIRIFNELQHTITGWPGGKPNADDTHRPERAHPPQKRVVLFSPHPDDDVISMGGTFIRLHEQGHEVHVAYQTSGDIAVFDHDVIRFIDFIREFSEFTPYGSGKEKHLYREVTEKIRSKKSGDVDDEIVRKIKALIRRSEARAGCRFVGLPDEQAHFLDLPFYETGLIEKNPLSQADIDIIVNFLNEIKPHQIFAAGDLSDPHGTHRVCLDAIFQAMDQLKGQAWLKDCWLWLYRGAWQEWDIADIDMAVPLSPDEVLKKRKAIFKHQSQKDSAIFPGSDPREFWQRAEDRNRETAELYDHLGLAEYEAMEAFKRWGF